eukprot:g9086.t1
MGGCHGVTKKRVACSKPDLGNQYGVGAEQADASRRGAAAGAGARGSAVVVKSPSLQDLVCDEDHEAEEGGKLSSTSGGGSATTHRIAERNREEQHLEGGDSDPFFDVRRKAAVSRTLSREQLAAWLVRYGDSMHPIAAEIGRADRVSRSEETTNHPQEQGGRGDGARSATSFASLSRAGSGSDLSAGSGRSSHSLGSTAPDAMELLIQLLTEDVEEILQQARKKKELASAVEKLVRVGSILIDNQWRRIQLLNRTLRVSEAKYKIIEMENFLANYQSELRFEPVSPKKNPPTCSCSPSTRRAPHDISRAEAEGEGRHGAAPPSEQETIPRGSSTSTKDSASAASLVSAAQLEVATRLEEYFHDLLSGRYKDLVTSVNFTLDRLELALGALYAEERLGDFVPFHLKKRETIYDVEVEFDVRINYDKHKVRAFFDVSPIPLPVRHVLALANEVDLWKEIIPYTAGADVVQKWSLADSLHRLEFAPPIPLVRNIETYMHRSVCDMLDLDATNSVLQIQPHLYKPTWLPDDRLTKEEQKKKARFYTDNFLMIGTPLLLVNPKAPRTASLEERELEAFRARGMVEVDWYPWLRRLCPNVLVRFIARQVCATVLKKIMGIHSSFDQSEHARRVAEDPERRFVFDSIEERVDQFLQRTYKHRRNRAKRAAGAGTTGTGRGGPYAGRSDDLGTPAPAQ